MKNPVRSVVPWLCTVTFALSLELVATSCVAQTAPAAQQDKKAATEKDDEPDDNTPGAKEDDDDDPSEKREIDAKKGLKDPKKLAKEKENGEEPGEKHRIPRGGPYRLPGEAARRVFSRQPYLQCPTSDSIFVVWRTLKPMSAPTVRFGLSTDNLDDRCEGPSIALRRLPQEAASAEPLYSAPEGTHQYEAHITGLRPNVKYFYAVYDGEDRLTTQPDEHFFKVLPPVGSKQPVTFWVAGDSGTAHRRQRAVHEKARDWMKRRNIIPDAFIHVGDMAYNDGKDLEFTNTFFDVYTDSLRQMSCFPAQGNHEGHSSNGREGIGPYYDAYICPTEGESGGVASGMEAYYSYDVGRAHVIVLNSHDIDRRETAPMAMWLQEDMSKVKPANTDWILAYFHHPCYTKGSHDSDKEKQLIEMRKFILPILEKGGVDLCLYGHSHIYERSMLIDGAYGTPTRLHDDISKLDVVLDDRDGIPGQDGPYYKSGGLPSRAGAIHITAGHSGTKNSWKYGMLPVMKKVSIDHGSVFIEINGDTLTGTMLTYQGYEFDKFQIVKKGNVDINRLASLSRPVPKPPTAGPTRNLNELTIPSHTQVLIKPHAEWRYLAMQDPTNQDWIKPDFDDRSWTKGTSAFGFGTGESATDMKDMKGKFPRLYVRKDFALDDLSDLNGIELAMIYDDGFVAYINGQEVFRANIPSGSGASVKSVERSVDDGIVYYFPLSKAKSALRLGKNVLAIECHNHTKDSADFYLHPFLVRKPTGGSTAAN